MDSNKQQWPLKLSCLASCASTEVGVSEMFQILPNADAAWCRCPGRDYEKNSTPGIIRAPVVWLPPLVWYVRVRSASWTRTGSNVSNTRKTGRSPFIALGTELCSTQQMIYIPNSITRASAISHKLYQREVGRSVFCLPPSPS